MFATPRWPTRTSPLLNAAWRGGAVSLLTACCLLGCARSPASKLIAASIEQLEAAEELLNDSARDPVKLQLAVMHYRAENRDKLLALRKTGDAVVADLDPAQRRLLASDSQARTAAVMNRIHKAMRSYPDPKAARRAIQPLIAQATPAPPSGPRKVARPWMPPLPPAPNEGQQPGQPGAATPTH